MAQQITIFRPAPARSVGLPAFPRPAQLVCIRCGCLKLAGYLCACERAARACGADDPDDDEDWRGELGGGDRAG